MSNLTVEEQSELLEVKGKYYMLPPLNMFEKFIESSTLSNKKAVKEAFNHIHGFMQDLKEEVDIILERKIADGSLKDSKQASKSIAGICF